MSSARVRYALGALAVLFFALTQAPLAQQPEQPFVPGELIVQYREGVTEARRNAIRATHGIQALKQYQQLRAERVSIPANANPIALAQVVASDPDVEAAQPNFIRRTTSVGSPNDPFFVAGNMWGLPKVSAPLAWSAFGAGADTVVVADIDTGVNYNHPDLAANMWRNPGEIAANGVDDDQNGYVDDVYGIDTANNDSDPQDDHGHGTHTSGTIAAVSDNNLGVTGLAKNVKILACKFLTSQGSGSDADAIECFNYVVGMKQRGVNVRVTNNSWGGRRTGPIATALKNAIDAAGTAGIVNVFSAGNDGANLENTPFDPASFTSPSIVSVAASDGNDAPASFTNYGSVSVDLAAPGVDILSTYGSGYAYASGTSMAGPHVAGAAAFLLSHRQSLSVAQVKDTLLSSVDLLGQWTGVVATGGRLNVFQAVNTAPGGGGGLTNVAAAAAGATATASSTYSTSFAAAGANNGDRNGNNWGNGGGWNDATAGVFPDWLQIDFSGNKTISELDVFTVQDAYSAPSTPTPSMTFTQYGVRAFEAQYWTGSTWLTIPGTTVSGNTLVWRHFAFTPITTSRIRIVVSQATDYSRITEVEAWGTAASGGGNTPPTVSLTAPGEGSSFTAPATITLSATASDGDGVSSVSFYAGSILVGTDASNPYSIQWTDVAAGNYALTAVALDSLGASSVSPPVNITVTASGGGGLANVAAAAAGAIATASSAYSTGYAATGANNGDRNGNNWGNGGGWNDGTAGVYPDWLQIDFSGSKTISELDVFTVQDAFSAPSTPTPTMTFTQYGVRAFEAQYWTGSTWLAIPGTTVSGNTLVWRHFAFTSITTSRIRIVVSQGADVYSRITEVEAWGTAAGGGNTPPTVALTAPSEGATFTAPATITLSATASDSDGISSVSFYAGSTLVGTDTTGPYSVQWTDVAAGSYALTAVALDNLGASSVSTAVNVTVTGSGLTNVAAATAGATATASSTYSIGFAAAGAINGDRNGVSWGNGGGWNDGTAGVYPDWLQIDFSGSKTISELDVFTVQDTFWAPSTPTPSMTFTQYGVRAFEAQYWTGSTWLPIPGTTVSGNTLVWRHFAFTPIATSRIRIVVSQGADVYSRITEVEAWGTP